MSAIGMIGAPRMHEREESTARSFLILSMHRSGMTYAQIAARLGCCTQTVWRRLTRARKLEHE